MTIVWDDPVNLMTYVTYVFQKLFGYSEPHATKLMMQVHNEGKAVVSAGSRECDGDRRVQASRRRPVGDACSRTAEPGRVRKWKRVETADGPRVPVRLAAHEATLLQQPGELDAGHAR